MSPTPASDAGSAVAALPLVDPAAPGAVELARTGFARDGCCTVGPVLPAELVTRAAAALDAVVAGEYDAGGAPLYRSCEPTAAPDRLVKIDQPHWASATLRELVTHPKLARWAAALSGASLIQVFGVQLLCKPPESGAGGNIGWHQDDTYWDRWWTGEAFTAWVALGEVPVEAGAVRFVRGSHRWGNLGASDFHGTDLEALRSRYAIPEGARWEEVAAALPAGGVSFHHRLTVHGSGPNSSSASRRSLAVHMRTDRAVAVREEGWTAYRNDDEELCPVIHPPRR